ncbi:MAG: hypothetical protein ACLP2Y_05700 [Limisphaerales bacterium]
MKGFSKFWPSALLGLGLMLAGVRAEAQSFGLSVTASPSPVGVSNSLTYTIIVTNLTGITPADTQVTNTLVGSLQILSATNSQGVNSISGNIVVFDLGGFNTGTIAQMAVIVQPTAAGTIADAVTAVSFTPALTPSTTNIVTTVTNTVVQQADLAVGMTVPASTVFTNDWMVYGVSVTNLGPNTAPNVFLTNTLPTGVGYKSVSPSNKTFTVSIQSSNVIFNLGTLTNGAFRNFLLTVQPTNAGVLPFVSVVSTNNGVLDPNQANNLASNNITVLSYFPGQLSATIASTQQYDPQDGLVEQSLLLSNTGTVAVASARVVITGLTNQLFNAWGTNNGNPFVVYNSPLDTNQSVNLLLQFFAFNYFSFSNSQLHAFAVTNLNLAPPTAVAMSTNVNITRILKLTNSIPLIIGSMLIEFPTLTNRTYTVVYTSNLLSTTYVTNYVTDTNNPGVTNIVIAPQSVFCTNWLMAVPSIVAPANRTQWIDYGPPATVSAPNSGNRFYRVFLNP